MNDALAERISRIEDILEIQTLQALYARYADRGWPGAESDCKALANLFTEDGIWTSERIGTFTGRKAIEEGLSGNMPFSLHLLINPHIVLDGNEASGTWRALFALTSPTNDALWGGGGYEVRYQRTDEGWRIRHLKTVSAFMSPYGQSWAEKH